MSRPDVQLVIFADEPDVGTVRLDRVAPPPTGPVVSDTLKFSNAHNGTVTAEAVYGGTEDCVDFNRGCSNLCVTAREWFSGGFYVATIKGGARDISLHGFIRTHGRTVDIDIDNYSDQSHAPSEEIYLNLKTSDGSPVRWRSWQGCRPVILNPEQRYECVFCLPRWLGWIVNRGYQLAKLTRVCA